MMAEHERETLTEQCVTETRDEGATSQADELKSRVTCPRCHSLYREPKLLPCLHVMCLSCLKQIATNIKGKTTGIELECPKCSREVVLSEKASVSAIDMCCPDSLVTRDLVSHYRLLEKSSSMSERGIIACKCDRCPESVAVAYCHYCAMFACEHCREAHRRWPEFSSHQLVPLDCLTSAAPTNRKVLEVSCLKHSEEKLRLYCDTCHELICHDCTLIQHRGHKYDFIDETVISMHRARIESLHSTIADLLKNLEQMTESVEAGEVSLSKQVANSKVQVEDEFSRIQQALETRKGDLLTRVDDLAREPMTQLQQYHTYVKSLQTQMSDCSQFITDGLQHCSFMSLLSAESTIHQHFSKVSQEVKRLKPCQSSFEVNFLCNKEIAQLVNSIGQVSSHGHSTTRSSQRCAPEEPQSSSRDRKGSLVGVSPDHSIMSVPESDSSSSDLSILDDIPLSCDIPKFLGIPVREIGGVKRPNGITVTSKIFTCEFGTHQVSVTNMLGQKVSSFGSMGDRRGQFLFPYSLALFDDGKILVTDSVYRVQVFTQNGRCVKSVGSKGTKPLEFKGPSGVAFGRNGQIYICEKENHRVQVLNRDLSFSFIIGKRGRGPGEFNFPSDVAVDGQGNVYVADSWNHRIQVFTDDGMFIHEFGQKGNGEGQLNMPSHVCVDPDGYLFVTEIRNHRVSVFRYDGNFVMSFGNKGNKLGQMVEPRGVAIDMNKVIYVSDFGNNRIVIYK